ncbi:transposase, partial [Streptomyces cyaneofuscatus]|uniref:transposase n=1 Tax=Streptomyces cyaneofuscatus TaxID=66883 RepID=UPI0033D4A9B3
MPTPRRRRHPSDTTAAEWPLLQPLLPVPACQTKKGGRPEKHPRREIVDAIRYITDSGAKWRALPADYPPWETVYGVLARWNRAGAISSIRDQLRRRLRTGLGRCPYPVTLIVDSQSVKAAETVSKATRGNDAGERINELLRVGHRSGDGPWGATDEAPGLLIEMSDVS